MNRWLLRFLAFVIDCMVVLLPINMMLSISFIDESYHGLLVLVLFFLYNVVCVLSFQGKTIGKYFSHLSVYSEEGGGLYLGIRELAKVLYFLPNVGLLFLLLNIIPIVCTKLTLHDWLGKSVVLLDAERVKL